jgi:hypothetical protein
MMALFSMAAWRCLRFSVAAHAVSKQINCVGPLVLGISSGVSQLRPGPAA